MPPSKGCKMAHGANSVHAGTEFNANLVKLKEKGEWQYERIKDLYAHIRSSIGVAKDNELRGEVDMMMGGK